MPPPPEPAPPLEYVQLDTADLPGLLPRERVREVGERVRDVGERERERVWRVCVALPLPLPKLQAEISDLPSLRERESALEGGPRMLLESAPGMPSVAVLTVGAFVGEPGRSLGSDGVRECRAWLMDAGRGRGDDERWPAARSSYKAMSSPAVRRETLPVLLLVVGWECSCEDESVEV